MEKSLKEELTDVTDIMSDLKAGIEQEKIRLESYKRTVRFYRDKVERIPQWIQFIFKYTIWK